jgi:hypothetical protein
MYRNFGTRQVVTALTGLDFGLRVRIDVRPAQPTLFRSPRSIAVEPAALDLAQQVVGLRVYSYGVRAQLEEVLTALQLNIASGSWSFARRAALDLASILSVARNRGQITGSRAFRASATALRVADLCESEAR